MESKSDALRANNAVRALGEKAKDRHRVFLSDRDVTYKRLKEKGGEELIPSMFESKYPVLKHMDEEGILYHPDAFDTYEDLLMLLHGEEQVEDGSGRELRTKIQDRLL